MMNDTYEMLELEGLGEWEMEDLEDLEYEDYEGDLFLGGALKRLARGAARAAGSAIAGRRGADIASMIANRVLREGEFEDEYESEAEFEYEFEAAGGDPRILAEMEYYAGLAAEAESEAEADQFLGALANLAGPLISSLLKEEEYEDYEDEADPFLGALLGAAKSLLPRAIPFIRRGVQMAGRFLRRPGTRRMIRALPRIAGKTATSLMRDARAGRQMTPGLVATTMAHHTARTLGSRHRLASAVRGGRSASRRYRRPGSYPRPVAGPYGRRRRRRIIRPRYCVY